MTSTNDGKDVKSNQTSGQKGKKYFITVFHSLEEHLSGQCSTEERTQYVCEAWRLVHSLCLNSTANTHPHLLSWVQRHTAHAILQDEWRLPENKHQHGKLAEAINDFILECHNSNTSPVWEAPLLRRALWFQSIIPNPWGHSVLKALLHRNGKQPTDEEVIEWLREERGMMLVTRLRIMARTKQLTDLALVLATAVMSRVRRVTPLQSDAEQAEAGGVPPERTSKEPTFVDILCRDAGFTKEVWELLIDIEFVLLHKLDHATCIDLAKKIPLKDGQRMVERLRSRLDKSPADKKLWKKAKDVAILIAQVVITRCMVVPRCAGGVHDALAGCAGALAQLLPGARLPPAAAAMAAPAASAVHLYAFANAIAHQCKDERKPFVCELYVRAITAGMNELERLKLEKEKEAIACNLQRTLSEWFSQLGEVLADSARLRCECLLTAFSVHPAADMYERVRALPPLAHASDNKQDNSEQTGQKNSEYGSWASDSCTRTNFVKTSETLNLKQTQKHANILSSSIFDTECEALGLSSELCEDLAVLLSGPRVKTLSWDMDRDTLLENCRIYMERTQEGTRALTMELKYLNLDPRSFEHLPEEADDENDNYGIEKGYEQSLDYEDLWSDDIIDYTERCDSVCSISTVESTYATPRHKKRKSKKIYYDDEKDPLRIETDFKDSNDGNIEESKKCVQNDSKEKQSDGNKKKSRPKVVDNKESKHLSESDKEKELLKKQKRKERRERKKKEKMLQLEGKISSPVQQSQTMLSRLVGLKVANAPEMTRAQHISITDSDYDSQGKSSLASANSEGNDSHVLFDGLFSMDDIRSPEKSISSSMNNTNRNKTTNVYVSNVIKHSESTITKCPQFRPALDVSRDKLQLPNSNTLNKPTANQQKQRNNSINFEQSYEQRELVKMNLKKLLQYRQQRRLNNHVKNSPETSKSNENVVLTKPVTNTYGPECLGMSQKLNTGIPYTQTEDINKLDGRSNKLISGDLKNVSKTIDSINYDYCNENKTNNKPLIASKLSDKSEDTPSQKQFQAFLNKQIPVSLQTSHSFSDPNQKQCQELRQNNISVKSKSNQQSINQPNINNSQQSLNNRNCQVLSNLVAQNNPQHLTDHSLGQPVKSVPIQNYSTFLKHVSKSRSCSNIVKDGVNLEQKTVPVGETKKQLKHKKTRVESVPNTFSRLCYMHKNKQADMKSKQSNEQAHKKALPNTVFSQVSGSANDTAYEKINNLQTKGEIVISKTQLNSKSMHRTDSRMLVKQGGNLYCPSKTANVQTEALQKLNPVNVSKSVNEVTENKIKNLNDQKSKVPINIQYLLHNQSNFDTCNKWKTHYANTTIKRKTPNVPISVCNLYKDDKVVMLGVTNKEVKHKTTAVQNSNKIIISKSKPHSTKDDIEDHDGGKVNTEDWKLVMNAIRALKTPNRGMDGQDGTISKKPGDTWNSGTINNLQNSTVNAENYSTKGTTCMNFKKPTVTSESGPIQIVSSHPKNTTKKLSKSSVSQLSVEQTKLLSNKSLKSSSPITLLHNSDYDQLDDLIDDDLRQEIEESSPLNSEEDSYRSVVGNTTVTKNYQVSENISNTQKVKTSQISNLNDHLQEASSLCSIQSTSLPILPDSVNRTSSLVKEKSQSASISRPKLHIISDTFLNPYPAVNMSSVNPMTIDQKSNLRSNVTANNTSWVNKNPIPDTTKIVTSENINFKNVASPISLVLPANIILTTGSQINQVANVINAKNNSRSSNNNTAIIEHEVPLIPDVGNQTTFVCKPPNLSLFNSTQFNAPVVNTRIIGNATINGAPKMDKNEEANEIAKTNQNDEHKKLTKDDEKIEPKDRSAYETYPCIRQNNQNESKSNITISKKSNDKNTSDSNMIHNTSQMSASIHIPQTTDHSDIDSMRNKFCERKVLSEVQEKQKIVINEVSEKKKFCVIKHSPETIAKTQTENDVERLRNKRLSIINRKVNHFILSQPIALSYASIHHEKKNYNKEEDHVCDSDKALIEKTGLRLKLDNDNNNLANVETTSLQTEEESTIENNSFRQLRSSTSRKLKCFKDDITHSKSNQNQNTNIDAKKITSKRNSENDLSTPSSNVTQKITVRDINYEDKYLPNEENKRPKVHKHKETQNFHIIDNQNKKCHTNTINSPSEPHICNKNIETKRINTNEDILDNVSEKDMDSKALLNTNSKSAAATTVINTDTLKVNPMKEQNKQGSNQQSSTMKKCKTINQPVKYLKKLADIRKCEANNEVSVVKITELTTNRKDESKKVLRLKLSNGNVFRATVSGHLKVDIKTILSEPAIKAILSQNKTEMKVCTLNVTQVYQPNNREIPVAITTYVKDQDPDITEVIDLVSDDEDDKKFHFKTEFGNYTVTSNDSEINAKHQWKFNQKCIVKMENCEILKNIVQMYAKTRDNDEDICITKNDNNNLIVSNMSMDEITISGNNSTNGNETTSDIKKDNTESIDIAMDTLNISKLSNSKHNILIHNQKVTSKMTKCNELSDNSTQLKKICSVNLVRCDDNQSNNLNYINSSRSILVKDTSNDSNNIHDNEVSSDVPLMRSNSPSILTDLSCKEDCIRSVSPSLIESFGFKLNKLESNYSNSCYVPSLNQVTCNSDWTYTKPELHNLETMQAEGLYLKSIYDFNISLDIKDQGDISTDCESDLENIYSNESRTECPNFDEHGQLIQVPALFNIVFKFISSNLDILEGYVILNNSDSPTHRLKRKLNKSSNKACKFLKTSYDIQIHKKENKIPEKPNCQRLKNDNTICDNSRIENTCITELKAVDKVPCHSNSCDEMNTSESINELVYSTNNATMENSPEFTKSLANTIFNNTDIGKKIEQEAKDNLALCDSELSIITIKNIDNFKLSLDNEMTTMPQNTPNSNRVLDNKEPQSNLEDNCNAQHLEFDDVTPNDNQSNNLNYINSSCSILIKDTPNDSNNIQDNEGSCAVPLMRSNSPSILTDLSCKEDCIRSVSPSLIESFGFNLNKLESNYSNSYYIPSLNQATCNSDWTYTKPELHNLETMQAGLYLKSICDMNISLDIKDQGDISTDCEILDASKSLNLVDKISNNIEGETDEICSNSKADIETICKNDFIHQTNYAISLTTEDISDATQIRTKNIIPSYRNTEENNVKKVPSATDNIVNCNQKTSLENDTKENNDNFRKTDFIVTALSKIKEDSSSHTSNDIVNGNHIIQCYESKENCNTIMNIETLDHSITKVSQNERTNTSELSLLDSEEITMDTTVNKNRTMENNIILTDCEKSHVIEAADNDIVSESNKVLLTSTENENKENNDCSIRNVDINNLNLLKNELRDYINDSTDSNTTNRQLPNESVTLIYKGDSDVVLKGSLYEDPIVGTCYIFPLANTSYTREGLCNHVCDDKTISMIKSFRKKTINEKSDGAEIDCFTLKIPKRTYSRADLTEEEIMCGNKRNLKRKLDPNNVCKLEKKYRKGKNIDYPSKQTKTAYVGEYGRLLEYCTSLKFSYSRPFHKDSFDISSLLNKWPIRGICCDSDNISLKEDEKLIYFDHYDKNKELFDPHQQTLAEEIASVNESEDKNSHSDDQNEILNFNMGFGERSDRVIQDLENGNDTSEFSAATLSDVKLSQPYFTTEDKKCEELQKILKTNNEELAMVKRCISFIELHGQVKNFFRNTTAELQRNLYMKKKTYAKKSSFYKQQLEGFPYELLSTEFFEPRLQQTIVNVVQVGQLPVSASAQNPVTCDPRVTPVANASPSQCSAENGPDDDPQSSKTEYTELTTADLSLPLVQEYNQSSQVIMSSQSQLNVPIDPKIPIDVDCDTKVEIKDEIEIKSENIEENDLETYNGNNINNISYSYKPENHSYKSENELYNYEKDSYRYESESYRSEHNTYSSANNTYKSVNSYKYENNSHKADNNHILDRESQNAIFDSLLKQENTDYVATPKAQNGTSEKRDQIAHAMTAAGIATTPETTENTKEHALVNVLSQKMPQNTVNTTQASVNSYTKGTPINAMALQQALAQILPPPLNQTNSTDNQNSITPQVLHIVQGKNTPGNQITIVDSQQNSVINSTNNTPVLHIVQNKSAMGSSTPNASTAASQHTNTFSGLSLVDAGLQQGGNQLLHIVNTGSQKNNTSGQLLKRVNLLTNLTNAQRTNEQKMVQFVCKSADGKSIQLNAPHQRSMVLRLQPIESTNVPNTPKSDCHDLSPTQNVVSTNTTKETNNTQQQEIKSRSVYEENYAKFIQNSSAKTPLPEKSTSLPKFNQAFGKQVYQDNNQKIGEMTSNNSHISNANNSAENVECPSNESAMNLEHINQINSPPLLLRKSPSQTSQPQQIQTNLVQQIKQTIAPMNIQTMHGGVIYTRQIPVNIGGGQTINLITVPSTDLVDENGQKQQGDVKFVSQNDIEQSIIKIVPQTQNNSSSEASEENNSLSGTSETTQNNHSSHAQPVLTQMRIKLPMLSKTPQMVSGARLVRPSFFQIQRNVIGGANQPVYQQLVLTAAPSLGQQQIRPQAHTSRPVKASDNQSSEAQMSSSTLEQLREFDMVLEQVKERSTVQPNSSSSNTFTKLQTSTDATDNTTPISVITTETPQQVLYSIGNTHSLNVAYVNRKPSVSTPTTSTYVRSPDSSGVADSPTSSTHVQMPHTSSTETSNDTSPQQTQPKPKSSSKSKSRPKTSSNPTSSMKINTVAPKTSTQKPLEDEQTTQRILYILAEYKEQVENSPDKDKPAPRRRTHPPSNPGSSKRKKSSSGSRRPGREMSPVHGEDTCRTMGSEDSSCGTSQGDCSENCLESHSPQDSPRKVVRKLTFEHENAPSTAPRPQPARNVIVADGQTITVARGTAGKPATAVLMPANYILPVSMVKGGQQIAIVTNRGPKILTVGGEGGATNALLLQRLIGPAGLKPVLARPGVRHVRLPTAALHNLQAFNLATAATVQPPDSTASPAPAPTPPDLVETRATSSPWPDRESQDVKPERGSSPEGSEPWNMPSSADPHDYSYEETVRAENMDRTVLDAMPDRYSPDMEAQRIFDKMFDVDAKKSYIDSQDNSPRCAYDIDASDCDDKSYQQVVQKRDQRQHRLAHMSAALRHKYAILEHELRLQKSLSEECEDLGVDSPSAAELFPEAELLFAASPAPDNSHHAHTPQPGISQTVIPQPDIDDQIATDQLLSRDHIDEQDLDVSLGLDEGIVTVSEDGQATITLDQEEFARSHPNTTFHSEPTEEENVQPYTITGLKGRHITSTIFHAGRAPATVLMAPQTTVISQAGPEHSNIKYIENIMGPGHNSICLSSVLVKDDGLTKYDTVLNDSRELHLSNTASAIVHSNAAQVIRRVCYEDDKRDSRFLLDETDALIAGDDAKMIAEDSSRDATLESIADDRSSPERHVELFWESNSASERSDSRRPLDFSSDSDKCCKSPLYDETNSTDSSGVGTHMRLDSVIKDARGLDRSGSADNSSADDTLPPLRTYPPKRMYHIDGEMERSVSGKTRAGERSPDGHEVRRRASVRGVVKRGCHCCNGSPAPPRPKKSRQKKPNIDFSNN